MISVEEAAKNSKYIQLLQATEFLDFKEETALDFIADGGSTYSTHSSFNPEYRVL
jgi:hypothetical protein